jgi:predicted Rossmann fold nucleotide-binding protein DprA/Smf involved in DNA uptake
MACVRPDGSLSASGQAMLAAVRDPATAVEVAELTALPLYRVRSGLRELALAGLVEEAGGRFRQTEEGSARERASQ